MCALNSDKYFEYLLECLKKTKLAKIYYPRILKHLYKQIMLKQRHDSTN